MPTIGLTEEQLVLLMDVIWRHEKGKRFGDLYLVYDIFRATLEEWRESEGDKPNSERRIHK